MITINNLNIALVYVGEIPILFIYQGDKLVWISANSCFSSGTWNEEKVWKGDDVWINNKNI